MGSAEVEGYLELAALQDEELAREWSKEEDEQVKFKRLRLAVHLVRETTAERGLRPSPKRATRNKSTRRGINCRPRSKQLYLYLKLTPLSGCGYRLCLPITSRLLPPPYPNCLPMHNCIGGACCSALHPPRSSDTTVVLTYFSLLGSLRLPSASS